MKKCSLYTLTFLLAFFTYAAPASTEGFDEQSWDSLGQLTAGQKIEVVQMDLKKHDGEFVSFNQETISLRDQEQQITCSRSNVLRVSSRGPSKRAKHMLMGMAIGAAGGTAIAIAGPDNNEDRAIAFVILAPIGASIGVGAGALVPAYDYRVVYRTKSPVKQ